MKRKIIWLLVSCLVATALFTVSCRPEEEDEVIIPEIEEPEAPVYEETFSVGDRVESDMLGIVVTKELAVTVMEMELIDSYEYYRVMDEDWVTDEASPGSIYIIAHVKIENLSSDDTYSMGILQMRGGDVNHVPSSYYMGEGSLESGWQLPPGEEMDGKVKFITPKDSTGYHVRFRFSEEPEVWAIWVAE